MLLEFTVGNYRSFGDAVTLSMVPTMPAGENKLTVLRSALLYGANASGKSNLFKALDFMRHFVTTSAREGQAGDSIGTESFLLHPDLALGRG